MTMSPFSVPQTLEGARGGGGSKQDSVLPVGGALEAAQTKEVGEKGGGVLSWQLGTLRRGQCYRMQDAFQ